MDRLPTKRIDNRNLQKKDPGNLEKQENVWDYLNSWIKNDAVTVMTLQTGPTGEGHEYHHAFAHKLPNGDIGLIGLSNEFTVNHAIGPNSKEGIQYRSDPNKPITEKIQPTFVGVVSQNGEIEGDIPAEYRDLRKVTSSFGYFYDKDVLGSLKLPDRLTRPATQIEDKTGEK